MSRFSAVLFTASLASMVLAKTDLSGCTSTDVSSPAGASIAWYVPGTGELCEFLDCGGGRAPPKTTVPGCPLYSGTASYSPSYLAGYGSMTTSGSAEATTTASASGYGSSSASEGSTSVVVSTSETPSSYDLSYTSTASATSVVTSSGLSTITSSPTPAVIGGNSTSPIGSGSGSSNGTTGGSTGSGNGTVSGGSSPSSVLSDSGAMETARAWIGGSALVGLGALVAAL